MPDCQKVRAIGENGLCSSKASSVTGIATGDPAGDGEISMHLLLEEKGSVTSSGQSVGLEGVYEFDPLRDPRWPELLEKHPRASVFHTPAWLKALQETYGYRLTGLTTSSPHSELKTGIVLCRIDSWLTGRRLVSLPFSDHCEPLLESTYDLADLLNGLRHRSEKDRLKYVEIRPLTLEVDSVGSGFQKSHEFCFHQLNLQRSSSDVFRSFHKSCVQRKIQRAERESLTCNEGRTRPLIDQFYHLLLLTRRRHQLPPQPVQWFYNIAESLGDKFKVRVVAKDGQPIAAMITLCYKNTVVYKYGCSDAKFHSLGGMALLFWRTIQEAQSNGLGELDMGRSDLDNPGLISFKEHWGAVRSQLFSYRYPAPAISSKKQTGGRHQIPSKLAGYLPDRVLTFTGRLLYKHFG